MDSGPKKSCVIDLIGKFEEISFSHVKRKGESITSLATNQGVNLQARKNGASIAWYNKFLNAT